MNRTQRRWIATLGKWILALFDSRRTSSRLVMAGSEPVTIEVNPDDPIAFVMSENLHRRHMRPTEKAACALRARDLYDQRAKERQRDHAGTAPGKKTLEEDLPQVNARARDEVGKVFGVSGRLVDHLGYILEATLGMRDQLRKEVLRRPEKTCTWDVAAMITAGCCRRAHNQRK
ncbi:hypothetical protein [Rosistilla carotiformis]|uniref:hypothetical protein n=1 Tax=Rosistilla carotiformis TaxID=2528017 RepID=UPI0011AAB1B4|nr:hypothetical protein [Rosistilla carotiformis]